METADWMTICLLIQKLPLLTILSDCEQGILVWTVCPHSNSVIPENMSDFYIYRAVTTCEGSHPAV
jgi:hypothetical protein